jgi:hypothetical protein
MLRSTPHGVWIHIAGGSSGPPSSHRDSIRPGPGMPAGEMDETIKPDLPRGDKPLSSAEAIREQLDTYGDSSESPNRQDQEDEHAGAEDS